MVRVDVDAHQLRRALVFGHGAHRLAELGAPGERRQRNHDDDIGQHRDDRTAGDDELAVHQRERAEGNDGGIALRRGAPDQQRAVLEEVAHADGRNQHGERRRFPQRLIGQPLDDNAQRGAHRHRQHNGNQLRQTEVLHGAEGDIRADHDDVAVGEVQHFGNAVNHRIAERDDGVDASQTDSVNQVGKKQCHFIHLICVSASEKGG